MSNPFAPGGPRHQSASRAPLPDPARFTPAPSAQLAIVGETQAPTGGGAALPQVTLGDTGLAVLVLEQKTDALSGAINEITGLLADMAMRIHSLEHRT